MILLKLDDSVRDGELLGCRVDASWRTEEAKIAGVDDGLRPRLRREFVEAGEAAADVSNREEAATRGVDDNVLRIHSLRHV